MSGSYPWLSGSLAWSWGNARFGIVELREGIALGAQQRDVGWAPFDGLDSYRVEDRPTGRKEGV
jgi:hypothetical protein